MAELPKKPIVKEEVVNGYGKIPKEEVQVRNISGRELNLLNGTIDKNDVGWATPAEVSNLEPQYIVRI